MTPELIPNLLIQPPVPHLQCLQRRHLSAHAFKRRHAYVGARAGSVHAFDHRWHCSAIFRHPLCGIRGGCISTGRRESSDPWAMSTAAQPPTRRVWCALSACCPQVSLTVAECTSPYAPLRSSGPSVTRYASNRLEHSSLSTRSCARATAGDGGGNGSHPADAACANSSLLAAPAAAAPCHTGQTPGGLVLVHAMRDEQ